MLDKTTYTFTCKVCKKEFPVACVGILQPLARPLSEIWAFSHSIIHHRKDLGQKVWLKAIWRLLQNIVKLILLTIFTAFRAISFIFYPLYILLGLLYEV